MKKSITGFVISAIVITACNNNSKSSTEENVNKDSGIVTNTVAKAQTIVKDAKTKGSMKEMVSQYLQMKNALASDNGEDAAAAGNAFVMSMDKMETTDLPADKKKTWDDLSDDAKEMAEHIGSNADKLEHQREHFDMLSKDMYDMVKAFGAGQVLYQDFCPMYNNNKGATWLSETKEISNPYLGKKMPTCGTVKEEIK